jgi:hypothetical protein
MNRPRWTAKPIAGTLTALLILSCTCAGSAQQQPQTSTSSSTQVYPDAPDPQNTPGAKTEAGSNQQGDSTPALGTAAALDMKPTGVTGSMLSGAAIAPAKQRRVKIILISLGVVAAAGIAIGTVVGLSHASPSQTH